MNEFDRFLKAKAKEETTEVPEQVKEKIEQTLSQLPEKRRIKKSTVRFKAALAAAGFCLVALIILPNLSSVYGQALEKLPGIGSLVKVVTLRNYSYHDDYHELTMNVPKIEGEASEATEYINKSVEELTKILADRFDEDLKEIGDEGHSSLYVDYEVVTNTEEWFTLKITVFEAAGSSNTYYEYYHIDKQNGNIIQLGDLAVSDEFYTVLEEDIKRQMREQMAADENLIYWVDDSPFEEETVQLDSAHNFYRNENGDLVIVFDKYEVAPGYMGTPEFTVSKTLLQDVLRPEYR